MFTCVKVPVILELKVTIPQQYGPEQPFDITKDVTCIGDEDDGDEDGCEDGDGDDIHGHELPLNFCDSDDGDVANGSPTVGVTGTVY